MLFANFTDAILEISWLAHQSAHKNPFLTEALEHH